MQRDAQRVQRGVEVRTCERVAEGGCPGGLRHAEGSEVTDWWCELMRRGMEEMSLIVARWLILTRTCCQKMCDRSAALHSWRAAHPTRLAISTRFSLFPRRRSYRSDAACCFCSSLPYERDGLSIFEPEGGWMVRMRAGRCQGCRKARATTGRPWRCRRNSCSHWKGYESQQLWAAACPAP